MSFAKLPLLYARWVQAWLPSPIPAETQATCQDCALLTSSAPTLSQASQQIHPRTKCCGYFPTLANFQVGRILDETDARAAPAQAMVAQRVRARFMASPLALECPPAYDLLYAKSPYMGSALKLQCPYYMENLLGGACGIWQHRNAVCMTWFCKHERGITGAAFWRALELLAQQVERALSYWCLTQLELAPQSLAQILPDRHEDKSKFSPHTLDETMDESAHRAVWDNWAGREAEFYRECGRIVSALDATQVLEIGGAEAALRLRVARHALNDLLSTDLPLAARPGNFNIQPITPQESQIVTYTMTAPLVLPTLVLNVLPYFQGRTMDEAIRAIAEQEQVEVEPALVLKLLDFGILVPVED